MDLYKLSVVSQWMGSDIFSWSRWHYAVFPGWATPTWTDIVEAWWTRQGLYYTRFLAPETTVLRIELRKIVGGVEADPNTYTINQTKPGDYRASMPPQDCIVVRRKTNNPSPRRQGRLFISPVDSMYHDSANPGKVKLSSLDFTALQFLAFGDLIGTGWDGIPVVYHPDLLTYDEVVFGWVNPYFCTRRSRRTIFLHP